MAWLLFSMLYVFAFISSWVPPPSISTLAIVCSGLVVLPVLGNAIGAGVEAVQDYADARRRKACRIPFEDVL